VEAAGIRHRYIRPRRPQQNGKVERSHRIDQEEFWGRQRFQNFDAAATALRMWEAHFNYQRFSLALQGRTPAEKTRRRSTFATGRLVAMLCHQKPPVSLDETKQPGRLPR